MPGEFPVAGFREPQLLVEDARSSLWRARSPQGPVLVRVYPDCAWPDSEGVRLRRGCEILEGLEHPAVPRPLSRGQHGEFLYLVLADPGTWTLRDHLHGAPLDPVEAAETALQVAEGLKAAHAAGLAHGSLRPDSTWIEPETGRIHLLGLEAGADLETCADLRALGSMLAFLLTAREEVPEGPALRRLCPELPPTLEWMVSRLRRAGAPTGYASAGEVVADLEGWLASLAPSARRSGSAPRPDLSPLWAEVQAPPAPRQAPPPRRLWPFLAALVLVAAWVGWLLVGSWESSEPELPPDELVFSSPAEVDPSVGGQPGRGILALEVRGLRPPTTTVQLKVRDGDKVVAEVDLPSGRGRVEIPRGRLLQLEIAADLHGQRTRTIMLDQNQAMVTLKTVLVRLTEVTISTVPGALVCLDRKPVGQADERGVLMLPPGSMEVGRVCLVSASKVGYETKEEPFTVKQGHTVVLLDLAPSRSPGDRQAPLPAGPGPAVAAPSGPFPGPLPPPPSAGAGPVGPVGSPPAPVLLPPSPATRTPKAPAASAKPSARAPSGPTAPVFPELPPVPARTAVAPSAAEQAPAPAPAPAHAPAPAPARASAPAPAPARVPGLPASSAPSSGSDLPVLIPDN